MSNTNWYKADNVAKVFLATHNKRDTRSMRVSVALTEEVNKEVLQKALDKTIKECPQFQIRIRRGIFWHYMEQTEVKPKVVEENDRPCPILYGENYRGILHYKVSYYGKRINLDMFHAISDGTGAMEFLDILVLNYLKLIHSDDMEGISFGTGSCLEQREQNSFSQFYEKGSTTGSIPKAKKSYQIGEAKLPYEQLQFIEIHLPASQMLTLAKKCNVSLGSFIGSQLMMAIYKNMPARQHNKPITISMPVNLRNFYPSETSRNFFNSIRVSYVFKGNETLEELCQIFDGQLKENIQPEKIRQTMNNFQQIERNIVARVAPLFIKQPVVKFFSKRENRNVTAVLSNMGKRVVPENMQKYVAGYSAFCSTDSVFIVVNSYGDDLVLGVSSAFARTGYLREFLKALNSEGVQATVYATEVVR